MTFQGSIKITGLEFRKTTSILDYLRKYVIVPVFPGFNPKFKCGIDYWGTDLNEMSILK